MYDDDFYDEPSEFEMMVDGFKASLVNSVKEEYINKMNELEKENAKLQGVKRDFESIKNGYNQKVIELNHKISKAKDEARKERLSDLMQGFEVIMYKVDINYIEKPKCDKCNDNRRIKYYSPSGKEHHEYCECSKSYKEYIPTEVHLVEFKINYSKNKMVMWYKSNQKTNPNDDYAIDASNSKSTIIYNKDLSYDEIDIYQTYFNSPEDCQKYCDWLNNKNKEGEI